MRRRRLADGQLEQLTSSVLAGDALDLSRRRVQQELHAHRGSTTHLLYRARRTLATGADCSPTNNGRDSPACPPATTTSRWKQPGYLPTQSRRLPRLRPDRRPAADDRDHRNCQWRRLSPAGRSASSRPNPQTTSRRRLGPLRPARHQQRFNRGNRRQGSNIFTDQRSTSATRPSTLPDATRGRRVQTPPTPWIVKNS